MEIGEQFGSPYTVTSPYSRGTPRRKVNGGHETHAPHPKVSLTMPSGLSGKSKPRPALADADIDKMLDLAAAGDSSDSEGEILIPTRLPGAGSVKIKPDQQPRLSRLPFTRARHQTVRAAETKQRQDKHRGF